MKDTIQIGNQYIGENFPIFIIAEVGINHNGDMDIAFDLIDKAKWAGASAVKFQTYITEKRVSKDSPIFDILKKCELSYDQQKELFEYANNNQIMAFSTPFDSESVEFLAEINTPCYKMTGNITTKNNGGFIQIRTLLDPLINSSEYEGIYIKVFGNNKNYSLHVRTKIMLAPWQYYSFNFLSKNEWLKIKAPFKDFKKSNFYQRKQLANQKIKSIGLVAGFDNFYADICLAEIGLY